MERHYHEGEKYKKSGKKIVKEKESLSPRANLLYNTHSCSSVYFINLNQPYLTFLTCIKQKGRLVKKTLTYWEIPNIK